MRPPTWNTLLPDHLQMLCDGPSSVLAMHQHRLRLLQASTLSNMACCYQRKHDSQTAMRLLQQSTQLLEGAGLDDDGADQGHDPSPGTIHTEEAMEMAEAYASAQLNLCVTLSSLRRYNQALECAQKGCARLCSVLGLTRDAWIVPSSSARVCQPQHARVRQQSGVSHTLGWNEHQQPSQGDGDTPAGLSLPKRLTTSASSVLTTCLYNEAVQHEHLGQMQQAHTLYSAAASTAARLLGRSSDVTRLFRQSLQSFKAKASRQQRHTPPGRTTMRHVTPSTACRPASRLRPGSSPRHQAALASPTTPQAVVSNCEKQPWDDSTIVPAVPPTRHRNPASPVLHTLYDPAAVRSDAASAQAAQAGSCYRSKPAWFNV
jgi:hypothetical protein